MADNPLAKGIKNHQAGNRPSPPGWTIEQSMQSLKNCFPSDRDPESQWSADITQPTTTGFTADLAKGIDAKHAENMAKEDHFSNTYEPKDVI